MKLSIVTTTYNSEEFIEDTILSVLQQNIEEHFEYLISDDGSSDNTIAIVKDIIENHPRGHMIRLICHEQNQGVMKNFFGAVAQTKGTYLAFCDSDDVWSDTEKLRKQLTYLENNQDCMMVYHSYINKIDDNLPSSQLTQFEEPINQIRYKPQTSTMMARGVLRDLINRNVVNETDNQNDQYLRFLLKDKGHFKLLYGIEPNIRVVRENSIFSTVNKLNKKRNALKNWQTIYKYHGYGENRRYLSQKLKGFNSSVKWLEFKQDKSFNKLWSAVLFDLNSGLFFNKIYGNIKMTLLKPLVYLKHRFVDKKLHSN